MIDLSPGVAVNPNSSTLTREMAIAQHEQWRAGNKVLSGAERIGSLAMTDDLQRLCNDIELRRPTLSLQETRLLLGAALSGFLEIVSWDIDRGGLGKIAQVTARAGLQSAHSTRRWHMHAEGAVKYNVAFPSGMAEQFVTGLLGRQDTYEATGELSITNEMDSLGRDHNFWQFSGGGVGRLHTSGTATKPPIYSGARILLTAVVQL